MGLEADAGTVSEAEGDADGAGGSGQYDNEKSCGARDTRPRSAALGEVEGGAGDRGATNKETHAETPRELRNPSRKREQQSLEADGPTNDVAARP